MTDYTLHGLDFESDCREALDSLFYIVHTYSSATENYCETELNALDHVVEVVSLLESIFNLIGWSATNEDKTRLAGVQAAAAAASETISAVAATRAALR